MKRSGLSDESAIPESVVSDAGRLKREQVEAGTDAVVHMRRSVDPSGKIAVARC
jgi:hypothetical protein